MPSQRNVFFQQFFQQSFALLITICMVRVYEYFLVASKFFIENAYRLEIAGLLYDVWLWFMYCFFFFLPFLLLQYINKRLAVIVFHCSNVILIICYLALIVVFSERNTPFDHEFFTRSSSESWQTAKQMMTSGFKVYIPFVVYLLLYFTLYYKVIKKFTVPPKLQYALGFLGLVCTFLINYANPSPSWFRQTSAYYLASNKFSYWVNDSYHYFAIREKQDSHKLNNKELEKEIKFYQKNHPFEYTSNEYPLLHTNNGNDVLGGFFNFKTTPPNIVILVTEGLSSDFSGENAYAGSFTPFLDSLSKASLVWDNFLSTAPGTFAAHPAISGSLPYGKRGFSIMNVMPEHLSLIKILKSNGYFTNFMVGFDPDFDNMGGYIRLQGTDFILNNYGANYKKMGVGEEGWSMGYPDDALFNRSFEILDSIKRFPYLSIYHTATTHMPYLFEQKPLYEKLFDKKIKTMAVSASIKRTLKQTKSVLVTFMFADDCIRKFFSDYSKRPEYNNTIFFITGDHHIGSFPSTGDIDDYHVPFIVYSPMLKRPKKFLAVNSHNNITPTVLALLAKNFKLPNQPKQVHWLADVIDTCATFRNIQSMAFMSWSRDISDYIYKDYFVSGKQLYKLTPNLLEEDFENDTIKNHIISLRENFKIINSYVCENNKIYPGEQSSLPGGKQLLKDYKEPSTELIFTKAPDTSLTTFNVPKGYKYLYAEFAAKVYTPAKFVDNNSIIRLALIDGKGNGKKYLYWSKREISSLSKGDFIPQEWNDISANDMFTLNDYNNVKDLKFEVAIYTDSIPINLKLQQLQVKIYGIRNSR